MLGLTSFALASSISVDLTVSEIVKMHQSITSWGKTTTTTTTLAQEIHVSIEMIQPINLLDSKSIEVDRIDWSLSNQLNSIKVLKGHNQTISIERVFLIEPIERNRTRSNS